MFDPLRCEERQQSALIENGLGVVAVLVHRGELAEPEAILLQVGFPGSDGCFTNFGEIFLGGSEPLKRIDLGKHGTQQLGHSVGRGAEAHTQGVLFPGNFGGRGTDGNAVGAAEFFPELLAKFDVEHVGQASEQES